MQKRDCKKFAGKNQGMRHEVLGMRKVRSSSYFPVIFNAAT